MDVCLISAHSLNFYLQKSSFICRIDLTLFCVAMHKQKQFVLYTKIKRWFCK